MDSIAKLTVDEASEETWHKHLELIQNVMTGMSRNSYYLKGWSVTLVSATFALSITTPSVWIVLIAVLPTTMFGALDAYYLYQEHLFRELYNRVMARSAHVEQFSLDARPYKSKVSSVPSLIFTVSVWPFYTVLLVTIATAAIIRVIFS